MIRKTLLALSGALALATTGGVSAYAFDALPNLPNLDFTQYTGSSPKGPFTSVNPVGWTGGNGLIFIDGQDYQNSAAGPVYLTTYGNPVGKITGNYVEADGNPSYESGFNFLVTGLTVGKTYTLSFYQGASAQTTFGSPSQPTTNQWIVSLGTSGLQLASNGPNDPVYGPTDTYFNPDLTASVTASPLMTVPYGTAVGWNYVSVNLKADATSDLLSFLAWGDNGSTVNLPPIAFLSGVNSAPGLGASAPELSTWALMALGVIGLGGLIRHQRNKRATSALKA